MALEWPSNDARIGDQPSRQSFEPGALTPLRRRNPQGGAPRLTRTEHTAPVPACVCVLFYE